MTGVGMLGYLNTIRGKLTILCLALLLIPSAIMAFVSYTQAKNSLNTLGETVLKNSVETSMQLLESVKRDFYAGNLTLEEAQEEVKTLLLGKQQADGKREITHPADLGETGYLYIVDSKGVLLMHPTREGESLWEEEDTDGEYFIRHVIEAAETGGFTKYYFALPFQTTVAQKVVYAKTDKDWGWTIAAGTYMQDFNAPAKNILTTILLMLAIAVVIGIVVISLVARHISSPLASLTKRVREVARGNLTVPLEDLQRRDEVGSLNRNFNEMVGHLKSLITEVEGAIVLIKDTSGNLSAVSEETTAYGDEIVRAITEVSARAEQQATNAESTQETSQQFTEQLNVLHDRNAVMYASSTEMKKSNEQGVQSLQTLQVKSAETFTIIERMRTIFAQLTNKMQEIESIVGTISDISDQTNLLALNASIEAARAGEHGKGFAVVAEEVRKLADQTVTATDSVRTTLRGIAEEAAVVTNEMTNTYTIVQAQNQSVASTELAFEELEQAVTHIVGAIDEVLTSVSTISESKEIMTAAIDSIAGMSEMNAAASEEVTASVEEQQNAIAIVTRSANELSDEIIALNEAIARFRIR